MEVYSVTTKLFRGVKIGRVSASLFGTCWGRELLKESAMVADPWILKMGNQVSNNLKQALLESYAKKKKNKKKPGNRQVIGILSFEVANVMSKTVHLHKLLTEPEISMLKTEIFSSDGVRNLISCDESYILELVLVEKLDELNRVASVVSRLGKKCSEPVLQGFEHVYGDIVSGVIHVKELGFLVKDMEGMVKKMDRYVRATRNLYSEMEVLNELEQAAKKFQINQHEESRRALEQKLMWQRQDVQHLREISLWNKTYDKIVEFLARTVCTIYARLSLIFGDSALRKANVRQTGNASLSMSVEFNSVSLEHCQARISSERWRRKSCQSNGCSGSIGTTFREKKEADWKSQMEIRKSEIALFQPEGFTFPCGTSPGRLFMDCLSLSSTVSKFDGDHDNVGDRGERSSQISGFSSIENGCAKRDHCFRSGLLNPLKSGISFNGDHTQVRYSSTGGSSTFGPKSKVSVYAPSSTVGGSSLALHYANVIIVVEKLLCYPHLVGEDAKDDLYQMLPTSVRKSLRAKLKSYAKNLAIYDAPLALDWKDTLDGILAWLAPLAHNMIRWQSERNIEQHQILTRTNVLLLQTLFFADRAKTEEAICELLVGLNYICRYEQQQNALLDCTSSFDLEDCMEWQLQCGPSFRN